jgi:hypothetical protein
MIIGARTANRAWPGGLIVIPALLAPVAVLLARSSQGQFLLPLLATAAIYPAMAALILRGRRGAAAGAALLWALGLSISVIAFTRNDPVSMQRVVLNGPAYRDEMFAYIGSGVGKESDPSRFLPEHALHLLAFSLLSAGSGGLLGIALGAILVGYMSFYVGSLAAGSGAPGTALLLGWPPWAILRVGAFVLIGICLAEPVLFAARRRLGSAPPPPAAPRHAYYFAAAALLVSDVVLKLVLARSWAAILRPCLAP